MIAEQTIVPEQLPPPTKFTNIQHELLSLYSMNVSDEDLLIIKNLIGKYFVDKLQKKVSEAAHKKGYTEDDFVAILNDPNQ